MVGQSGHLILRVTDVQHRDFQFIVQALQVRQDFVFSLTVERCQRFVHQQQLRAGEQRTGDADSLPFATGKVLRVTLQQMADSQQFRGMTHVDPTLLFRDALEAKFQIRQHRQMRKQAGFLEDITQRALMRRDKNLLFAVLPDLIVDPDETLLGLAPGPRYSAGKWSFQSPSVRKVPSLHGRAFASPRPGRTPNS